MEDVTSPAQRQTMLRLALEEMSERNAHHEFENLCREVARARIASNILPATGPVAGGGDQGRDFETFATFIKSNNFPVSAFAAHTSSEALAFACTLQSSRIEGKVVDDLTSITAQGTEVDRVYIFLGASLPVSKRHSVIERARRDFSLPIEIIDRHALAEMLADADLFWAAVEYLHVPSALRPMLPQVTAENEALPAWYTKLRDTWRQKTRQGIEPSTFADFVDLREGLDYALFHEEGRPDLDSWTRLLTYLQGSEVYAIRQRARYSVAVARYRGGSTLNGDLAAEEFFSEIDQLDDTGLIQDSVVLLVFLSTAIRVGHSSVAVQQLNTWRSAILTYCEGLVSNSPGPNTTASVLASAIYMCILFDPAQLPPIPDELRPVDAPPADLEAYPLEEFDVAGFPLYNASYGMRLLEQLVLILPEAPLFPAQRTAEIFDLVAPLLVDFESFEKVREGLDQAVAHHEGRAAVARRAKNRGMRLLSSGKLIQALNEMHDAKEKWWNDRTLEESVISLLAIAQIYMRLHLAWAAKMYALAASNIAGNSGNPKLLYLVPIGFLQASECEAVSGSWLSSAETIDEALSFHAQFTSDPWDTSKHTYFATAVKTHLAMFTYASSSSTTLFHYLENKHSRSTFSVLLSQLHEEGGTEGVSAATNYVDEMTSDFSSAVPADAGPTRTASWSYRGMSWTASWANNYENDLLGERFVSLAQITLVEVARIDFVSIVNKIEVSIFDKDELDGASLIGKGVDSEGVGRWDVGLSGYEYAAAVEDDGYALLASEVAASLLAILAETSVRSSASVESELDQILSRSLLTKLIAGRPHDELVSYKHTNFFQEAADFPHRILIDKRHIENSSLPASTERGVGYDPTMAMEAIQLRYQQVQKVHPYTLAKVTRDPTLRSILRSLREQGWLDWHLLTAIANIVANYRINAENLDPDSDQEQIMTVIHRVEEPGDALLPLDLITPENLQDGLEGSALGAMKRWDLQPHISPLPAKLVLDLLFARYEYADDVQHTPWSLD